MSTYDLVSVLWKQPAYLKLQAAKDAAKKAASDVEVKRLAVEIDAWETENLPRLAREMRASSGGGKRTKR